MEAVSDMGRFGGENRKWWTLAAVSLGLFMIMLDNTVVNVALPSIQHDLGLSLSELEWVVAGYALTFAAFMLTGGKLADLLGRRLMFVVGPSGVHRRVARVRARRRARDADRRARRAGRRRRADEPGDALDHHGDVPARGSAARRSASGPASPRSRSRSGRSSAGSSPSTSTGAGSSSSTSPSA